MTSVIAPPDAVVADASGTAGLTPQLPVDEGNPSRLHGAATPATAGTPLPIAATAASLALAACGGGGGGGGGGSSTGSSSGAGGGSGGASPGPTPTSAEAARFLHQASLAATDTDIASVQQLGYSAWLDQQFAIAPTISNYAWLNNNGFANITFQYPTAVSDPQNGYDAMAWRALISEVNPVVQRLALMWSEIFVVNPSTLPISWNQFATANFFDVLTANATGSFRALLKAVTLSPAMGAWLSLAYSSDQPVGGAPNVHPDENYAREVMQLMSIGLYQLNQDGSLVLSGGNPVPTYGQADVIGLAAALTGWGYAQPDYSNTPTWTQLPMVQQTAYPHTTSSATFLGVTISGGTSGAQALEIILDTLVNHPNTAPFISKQVIQRLVTSNPSAAYIQRIAGVFANDGSGNRGNLAAVIKAVLLDTEARTAGAAGNGRVREPMLRLVQWARTFGATSAGAWSIGDTSAADTALGQSPFRSPTVFNYFAPSYTPPGSAIAAQGLVAPEMQIYDETSFAGYLNYLQTVVSQGAGDVKAPYTTELTLAANPTALLARLNLLLAANQLDPTALALITSTVSAMPSATPANLAARVQAAVFLVMSAPSYLVLK